MKKVRVVLLRESSLLKYYLDKEKSFGNPKDRMSYVTLEFGKGINHMIANRPS